MSTQISGHFLDHPSTMLIYDNSFSGYRALSNTDFTSPVDITASGNAVQNYYYSNPSGEIGITGGYIGITGNFQSNIRIISGDYDSIYIPSGNVNITNTPSFNLLPGAQIGISGELSFASQIGISGGYLGITGTPNFNIINTPTVSLSSGSKVGITGNISLNTTQVGVSGGYIGITGTPTFSLQDGTNVGISGGSISLTSNTQVGISGNVHTITPQYAIQSNYTVSGTAGNIFTLGLNSIGFIRNLDVNPLYIKYGSGCNSISFSDILFGGVQSGDGKGNFLFIDNYQGIVSVSGSTMNYLSYTLS